MNIKISKHTKVSSILMLLSTLGVIMEQVQYPYSMKNIPIPSKQDYMTQMIHSVEKFTKNIRWRSFHYRNLCLREKFCIIFKPEGASLNGRSELFSTCRHRLLLDNTRVHLGHEDSITTPTIQQKSPKSN